MASMHADVFQWQIDIGLCYSPYHSGETLLSKQQQQDDVIGVYFWNQALSYLREFFGLSGFWTKTENKVDWIYSTLSADYYNID